MTLSPDTMQHRPSKKTNTKQQSAKDYAKLGNQAYRAGNLLHALEYYAHSVSKEPDNQGYKLRLAHLLKDVHFTSFNPKFKTLILRCLQTDGIDHQSLATPWFSLFSCDNNYDTLHKLMQGEDVKQDKKILSCLKDSYFTQGIACLSVYDVTFESMLHYLGHDLVERLTLPKAFKQAFDAYCARSEYIFCAGVPTDTRYPTDKTIPTLGIVSDTVSENVRSHYEQNPYPRWTSINIQTASREDAAKSHKHLIAGCGTGNGACATALKYPNAQITAIDLSLSSLTYAKSKAHELGLDNISFLHGDILNLSDLKGTYDVIECSGVLHHMDDPAHGWRCLINKLADNGKMHIGLYSELGRSDVIAVKTLIEEHKYEPTHAGITSARNRIIALPDSHPAKAVLTRRDFYSTSSCRDLIFHQHEYRYTIQQLQKMLDELNLVFDGFDLHTPATAKRYLAQYPDDPKMLNLENWHLFEIENPDIFRGMYQFWCHVK